MNRGQSFLLLLIGLVALLTLFIVRPFVEYVIAAGILAYVLHPIHEWLTRRIYAVNHRISAGYASMLSALSLIVASVVAVVLPLVYISLVFVDDLLAIAEGESDLDIAAIEARIAELTGEEVDIATWLSAAGETLIETLFGGAGDIITSGLQAGLGLTLTLFLLYYTLRAGPEFVTWLRSMIPLPDEVTDDLFAKIDATTWGVVVGHISVAVLQAVIAGVGLWVVGIPNVVFWTFVMVILALLPLIGAFLVWGPAAAYLVVVDEVAAGVALALYGLLIVSTIDTYARPILIDKQAHINPGVILVGVFGGIYSIGFTGLFVGPIVIGVLAATLETFREDYDTI